MPKRKDKHTNNSTQKNHRKLKTKKHEPHQNKNFGNKFYSVEHFRGKGAGL